jgi:RNA polymerase sigma-70 factor, ECF subfamily
LLREVLGWRAAEVADLLARSVPSVNSALQRARATLAERDLEPAEPEVPLAEADRELLGRYVDAFERYDVQKLTALAIEDATLPPWLRRHARPHGRWYADGVVRRPSAVVPRPRNRTAQSVLVAGRRRCVPIVAG